ncbi:Polysaccharide monooxygenase Cel61a [Madurella mycetomatis]|uniref:lytic cellulose monooxygenase (C4-dehydrogenating) n=1 Tax=Madurella mycetomatis TaxID=100816 RepID=A0A175WA82_9PEZI|nr:Polysaccharide monooxygenase Cel61a [Madurella mycetomatis]
MYVTNILSALLTVGATTVSAHGFLKYIDYDGTRYLAWQVGSDEYVTPPNPLRFTRRINTLGPAVDFTSNNITCGEGGNTPPRPSSASNPAGRSSDSGPVWVKIDEMAFDANASPQWASDKLATLGASWTFTIPPNLADGEYLLRHEILGLHVAGTPMGAQFYPVCAAINVTGGGNVQLPTGISLPGAYDPTDPGILVELWHVNQGQVEYTAPGGPVWSGAGEQLLGAGNVPAITHTVSVYSAGGAAPETPAPTVTNSVGTSTSSPAVPTTSTAPGGSPPAGAWQQCGGVRWSGATSCVSGYTCSRVNDYYSQCQP